MIAPEAVRAGNSETALHQVQSTWSPYSRISAGTRSRLRRWWKGLGFNRDIASKLRYEMDMALLRGRCAMSIGFRCQVRKLGAQRNLLVHLGCGRALIPGWVNVDCYPPPPSKDVEILTLDVRRGLPLAAGSVDAVFTEHFLEHLPVETVEHTILPELRRILAPGGRIRIGVPDGEYFVEQYVAYRAGKRDALYDRHRGDKTPMIMLNEIAHGFGHYFVYDFETMDKLLRRSGFVDVLRQRARATDCAHFVDKDRIDDWRNAMTLYVEARVPESSASTPS